MKITPTDENELELTVEDLKRLLVHCGEDPEKFTVFRVLLTKKILEVIKANRPGDAISFHFSPGMTIPTTALVKFLEEGGEK